MSLLVLKRLLSSLLGLIRCPLSVDNNVLWFLEKKRSKVKGLQKDVAMKIDLSEAPENIGFHNLIQ